jgi:hypothetical protein
MIRCLTLALLLTATPLWAEGNLDPTAPAQPGAVALFLQARSLYQMGQAAKDPLMVLTAVQILRGLSLTDTTRTPDPAPETPAPLTVPDPAQMLDTARTLDAGQNYTDLIDSIARQSGPTAKALRATAATLDPAQTHIWTLTFFGAAYAELAIAGHGNGNLDLLVSDDKGTIICQDNGSGDSAHCGFTPAANGTFTVTVTNAGTTPDGYILLTN